MRSVPMCRTGQVAQRGGAAVLMLLGACGLAGEDEPAEPLVIERGSQPPETGQLLDLGARLDASGFFDFDSWPPACELLGDAEIEAVLPQVEAIDRQSDDVEIVLFDTGRRVTAAGAECRMELDIPEAGLKQDSSDATIRIGVEAAGSPEVVDQNFRLPRQDPSIDVPGGECYASEGDSGRMACRKGPLAFEIRISFGHQELGSGSWTDRYVVDGETTTFTAERSGDVETYKAGQAFLRETLGVELARIILAKIDGSGFLDDVEQ